MMRLGMTQDDKSDMLLFGMLTCRNASVELRQIKALFPSDPS
jgi:hypothetical protein